MPHLTSPSFFKQGYPPRVRLLFFFLLSFALLMSDTRLGALGFLREKTSLVLYPVQWVATTPVSILKQVEHFFTLQTQLLKENTELKRRQLHDATSLMRYEQLQFENTYLRQVLELRGRSQTKTIPVEVLYNGRDPFTHKLIVDHGENAKIREGQIVIDPRGVIGQITRVHPFVAEVTLMTDKNHTVPIQVQRNGLRAVLFGLGRNHLMEVRYQSQNADIKEGDLLVTSGLDGFYPVGLPVARVQQIDRAAALPFARILCTPVGEVDKHRFLLILSEFSNEKKPLPPPPESPPVTSVKKGKRNGK